MAMRAIAFVLALIGTLLHQPAAIRYAIALLLLTDGHRLSSVPQLVQRLELPFMHTPSERSRRASGARRALPRVEPPKK